MEEDYEISLHPHRLPVVMVDEMVALRYLVDSRVDQAFEQVRWGWTVGQWSVKYGPFGVG